VTFSGRPFAVLVVPFFLLLPGGLQAETNDLTLEHKVKAAYIYNIIKFVEWPASIMPTAAETINICILGDDPITEALQPVTAKTAHGRAISLQRISAFRPENRCHVLFISATESAQHSRILSLVEGTSVLTVSSNEAFIVQGCMVGLVIRDGKLRLVINLDASRRAGISLSSKLLEVAIFTQERRTKEAP
jgi:YfiR/HmsC-like